MVSDIAASGWMEIPSFIMLFSHPSQSRNGQQRAGAGMVTAMPFSGGAGQALQGFQQSKCLFL